MKIKNLAPIAVMTILLAGCGDNIIDNNDDQVFACDFCFEISNNPTQFYICASNEDTECGSCLEPFKNCDPSEGYCNEYLFDCLSQENQAL